MQAPSKRENEGYIRHPGSAFDKFPADIGQGLKHMGKVGSYTTDAIHKYSLYSICHVSSDLLKFHIINT